jgi:Mrp family chromosome partitioning ATPase/capsular polysaccharide biosynthesis protein
MELRQIFGIVWKWIWLVTLAVVIASGSSYIASKTATPIYRTKTTLMIGRVIQNPQPTTMDLYASQQLAYTYIQLAKREPVLKGAIEGLGLNLDWQALAGQVSASNIPQTQLLEISVVDSDPYRAKVLADAISQQLILLSPAAENKGNTEELAFTKAQLVDLKSKIENAQKELTRLRQELDASNSARQIQDLQNQIFLQDSKISGWQNTYSQLLLTYQGGDVNTISVVEEAAIPTYPFSPNTKMNVLTAAAIGLALAVGGAFLIEYLDDTIKSPDDVTRNTNLPTLGAVPMIEGDDYSKKLIAVNEPLSPIVESFRILRTNLQFSTVDRQVKTMLVTSPGPSEGKSISLANLAVVLAQSGLKVIVVDTDLRRPTIHKIFDLPNRHGLTDALLHVKNLATETHMDKVPAGASLADLLGKNPSEGNVKPDQLASTQPEMQSDTSIAGQEVSDYIQDTSVENLQVLTTGPLPPNPAELLGSERLGSLIEILKKHADLLLFDSPPNLVVADAAILSSRMDGVIMVNDVGRTRTNDARRAVEELRRGQAKILGIILNRIPKSRGGYNYYYYYYNYYYQDGERQKKRSSNWLSRTLPWFSGNHRSKENGSNSSTEK